MNLREFVGAYRQPYRVLLILQGDQAFWFKWQDQTLLESFVEPIFSDMCGRQSRCPWIDNDSQATELAVELILDTSLDELDRVTVDSHSSRLVNRIQSRSLMRKLSVDFPGSSIAELPKYLEPACASIMHHVIPDSWENWLNMLQARTVTVTHVVTGTELLCSRFRDKPGLRLLVQDVGIEKRHLVIDGPIPVYMRLVQIGNDHNCPQGEDWDSQSIAHTLDYVNDKVLPYPMEATIVRLTLNGSSPSREFAATQLLSILYLGQTAELVEQRIAPAMLRNGGSTGLMPSVATDDSVVKTSSPAFVSTPPIWRRFAGKHFRRRWLLSGESQVKNKTLTVSLRKNRLQNRIIRLQQATLICAAIATLTALFASAHAFSSTRERYRLNFQKAELRDNLDSISQSVQALHSAPSFVMHSLQRIEYHERIEPPLPEQVLTTVAEVFTRFPALTLNRLSWTVMTDNQLVDEVFTTVAAVSSRDRIWAEDSPPAHLQLELSGIVEADGSLREKQHMIDLFVSYLEGVPGIDHVTILNSPLDSALSGNGLSDGNPGYRVSVMLGDL